MNKKTGDTCEYKSAEKTLDCLLWGDAGKELMSAKIFPYDKSKAVIDPAPEVKSEA